MKTLKISLVIILSLLFFEGKAQLTKHSLLLGANLSFDTYSVQQTIGGVKNTLPSMFNLNVNPKLGFFIINNLAIGAEVNFSFGKDTTLGATNTINKTNFLIGPFARYYIFLRENIYLFPEASIGIGLKSTTDYSQSLLGFGAGPGMAFFIGDNLALETVAKYNFINGSNSDVTETISNLNFSVGLFYYYRARQAGIR